MNKKIINPITVILFLSICLFLVSLSQECFCTSNKCYESISIIFVGCLSVFVGGATLTWFANPLIIITWILTYSNKKFALFTAVASSIICFSFLKFDSIIMDESGHYWPIFEYKIGYWLWTLSSLTLTIGNAYLLYKRKNPGS